MPQEDENKQGEEQQTTSSSAVDWESRAKNFEAKLTDMEKRFDAVKDIDPERYIAQREEIENLRKELSTKDPDRREELLQQSKQELEQEIHGRYEGKLNEATTKISTLERDLRKYRITNPLKDAAAKLVQPDSLPLVEMLAERELDIDDSGQVFVKGEDGKPVPSKENPRDNMGITEYLKTRIAEQYPSILLDTNKRGTRSNSRTESSNGSSSGRTYTRDEIRGMSKQEIDRIPVEDLKRAFS